MHGLLEEEIAEIIALYHEWGEVDRSHRKLAHRGSYLERVWVSPASVQRVLAAHGLVLHPRRRSGTSVRKPFPEWVDYRPNQLWIYDTTHFPRARVAVTVVEDLVSRKWLANIVSAEETSTQIEIVFTDALAAEGLLEAIERCADGLVDPTLDDQARPILHAILRQRTADDLRVDPGVHGAMRDRPALRPGPAPRPTRRGSKASSATSKTSIPTSTRSQTQPSFAPSWPSSTSTTTASGSTPQSATSPPRRARRTRTSHPHSPRGRPGNSPPAAPCLPSHQHPPETRPETRRCRLIEPGSLSRSQKQVTA